MFYLSAHMTQEESHLFGEGITVCLCQHYSFKSSARKLSVIACIWGELSTFGEQLAEQLMAFYS